MIKWREGKAGFVGGSKRFIKGFFDFSFTLTSEDVEPPEPDPVPSGNKRTLSFNSLNRSTMSKSLNRTSGLTSKNRKMSI